MRFVVLFVVSSFFPFFMSTLHAAPPLARRANQVDELHGVRVADPYRWMEDVDSAETRAWVQSQVAFTGEYMAKLPVRDRIRSRLQSLMDYTSNMPLVLKRGGKLF